MYLPPSALLIEWEMRWRCFSCHTCAFHGKGHMWWECMGRSRRVTMPIVLFCRWNSWKCRWNRSPQDFARWALDRLMTSSLSIKLSLPKYCQYQRVLDRLVRVEDLRIPPSLHPSIPPSLHPSSVITNNQYPIHDYHNIPQFPWCGGCCCWLDLMVMFIEILVVGSDGSHSPSIDEDRGWWYRSVIITWCICAAIDSVTVGSSSNGWTVGVYQWIRGWTCRGVPRRPVGGEAAIFIFILFWMAHSSSAVGSDWLFDVRHNDWEDDGSRPCC